MKRSLGIVMVLAMLALSLHGLIDGTIAQDATPASEMITQTSGDTVETGDEEEATAADSGDACVDIVDYARMLIMLASSLAASSANLPADSVAQWADDVYTKFIDALTWTIQQLTGATPPEAAAKLNDYAIQALEAVQAVVTYLRTSDTAASLPFGDKIGEVGGVIDTIVNLLDQACPGTADALATPVASPMAG